MKTKSYVYGVAKLNGNDAWALFKASAQADVSKAQALLAKDRRLANAQYWYRFPIHMAVFAGSAEMVELLLDHGADPGQSIYTYDSWDKLLRNAQERGHRRIEALLTQAMQTKFNYSQDFDALREVIIARDTGKIDTVLRHQPQLALKSDALGNNAIHWSVITRQLELIKRFVELGTPIDAARADGQTPVLLAVNGAIDYWYRATRGRSHPLLRNTSLIVGYLLALGANYGLSVAAAAGDQERTRQILQEDPAAAYQLDLARLRPLSYAAREGHLHLVQQLIDQGADPNLPEDAAPRGRALYEACRGNYVQVAQLLLEHGADPNAGVDSSACCLTIGEVYHGNQVKPLQELLRRYGAYTPPYRLSFAQMKQALRDGDAVTRDSEFVDILMAKGDSKLLELHLDSEGRAVDQLEVLPRSPTIVRHLLDRGLNPNRTDWLGKTFLHTCAENGDRSAASALLDAGADINARDFEFQGTPLAAAIRSEPRRGEKDQSKHALRQRRMVQFLLKRGAATNLAGDELSATPLAWARKCGLTEIETLLVEHGAAQYCIAGA